MKSILMIGMGRFGQHLCKNLVHKENEVMVVDQDEAKLENVVSIATSAQIGDCTKEEVLRSFGVANFDVCIVCIGTNFQSSLEITCMLKELGAKYVISKTTRDVHAKFLLRNGADEVIYPDRDVAERLAVRLSANHVFDYIEMGEYGIYEIPPHKKWIGKSIKEVNFRVKYRISILGTKENGETNLLPSADHIFKNGEHLIVIGKQGDVEEILENLR